MALVKEDISAIQKLISNSISERLSGVNANIHYDLDPANNRTHTAQQIVPYSKPYSLEISISIPHKTRFTL